MVATTYVVILHTNIGVVRYQAYAESHESDPTEISEGFKELEEFLCNLPLEDNNAVFNLCCRLCCAYERKAFIDGLQYGAFLMRKLFRSI